MKMLLWHILLYLFQEYAANELKNLTSDLVSPFISPIKQFGYFTSLAS